jgi:radial spoke head protein 9
VEVLFAKYLQNGEQQVVNSDDEDTVKVPPKNFLEIDRLAYVVRAIEVECQIVPVGSFRLTPQHQLRYNDQFRGLDQKEALQMASYQHFRNPVSEEK